MTQSPAPEALFLALCAACAMIPYSLYAAVSDVWCRRIPNDACLLIAMLAIPYWLGIAGLEGWRVVVWHLCSPLLLAAPLIALFVARIMDAGDVKLGFALSLWMDLRALPGMMAVTALSGVAIAAILLVRHRHAAVEPVPSVPYGAALTTGAAFALLPAFAGLLALL